jgi:hydroxyethylthiazole kinase-like uncharacterized protein yjeF
MTTPTPIYTTAEIRSIERLTAPLTTPTLMERAGLAAAEIARDQLLTKEINAVLVLAGPGNNGGDAFVVARYLKSWWFNVTLVFSGNHENLPNDAKHALDKWLSAGGEILTEIPENKIWGAVIDGLFGIGLDRDLVGKDLALVNAINLMHLPVLALDIPSGLGSDNGDCYGATVRATMTVTFISLKPGLLTRCGPDYCGEIFLCKLDLDPSSLIPPHTWKLDQAYAQKLLPPPRPSDSHKGMFGSIGIIGGSAGIVGAALLAGTAALKLGTGRVYLGLMAADAPVVSTVQPELMLRPVHELLKIDHLNCLIVGPGLGIQPDAYFWLKSALESRIPLVLDADALNLIATHPELASLLRARTAASILTPHVAEAARLLGTDSSNLQHDRMAAAAELTKRFNCYAVLKGVGSICAFPDGRRYLNTSGNPGLSSAGTGDVLSGIIGALLAQGLNAENALLLAVHLHGAAADSLLERYRGPVGMTASEVTDAARSLLNRWLY